MKKQIMWCLSDKEGYIVQVYHSRNDAREDKKYLENETEFKGKEKFIVGKCEIKTVK